MKIKIPQTIAKIDIIIITPSFVNKTFPVSITTIISAIRLFKKCAKIGISTLSVFRYKIAIQTAKINAAVILPKLCNIQNSKDEITIENDNGTINFSLFNKTPLKISSSLIGEINTVAIKPLITNAELLIYTEDEINGLINGKAFKIKLDK